MVGLAELVTDSQVTNLKFDIPILPGPLIPKPNIPMINNKKLLQIHSPLPVISLVKYSLLYGYNPNPR